MNHNYGNEYTFTLKHDNGTARVVLFQPFAPDALQRAIRRVLGAELCPPRAIKKIEVSSGGGIRTIEGDELGAVVGGCRPT